MPFSGRAGSTPAASAKNNVERSLMEKSQVVTLVDAGSSPVVQPNSNGEVAELVQGARLLSGRGLWSHRGSNPRLSAGPLSARGQTG